MAGIIIPSRQANTLRSETTEFLWPVGVYRGVIEQVEVRALPSKNDGTPFAGFSTTDGESLGVRLGEITAIDPDTNDVGNRKWFLDLPLSDGDFTVEQFADAPKDSWQLERSARMITNLAAALGQVDQLDDDNVSVKDGFVEALKAGEYDGTAVGFSVYHKPNRKDPKKPFAEIEYFIFTA